MGTYKYKYQKVQNSIDGAATDEESIDVKAVALNIFIETVPSEVNWVTASLSLSPESIDTEPTYH